MKRKQWGALALSGVLALSLAVPALAEEAAPAEPLTREDSALRAAECAVMYGGAVSLQYALWEDGEITLSGHTGVYSRTENRALTEDILYGVGSVSKVYTTAAVMQLAEEGKLDLDEPVTAYLPDFTMADGRYKDITVRMLLNHSSGLMGSSTADAFLFADGDQTATEDLLARLAKQRLKADPGAYSVYCNDGFTLAELVVEAVSGQSFTDYLHAAILTPAGLENTFTPQDGFDTARLAKTYLGEDMRALPQDTLGIVGTGGIYATASDLAAFGGALTGTALLSSESTSAMAAPEYKNGMWPDDEEDQVAYGLGWDSVKYYPFAWSGVQALAKGGDTQYYHAGLVVLPEYDMAAAVLSSGGVSVYNEMAAARMLIDALAERGVAVDETAPAFPEAEPAPLPAELQAYAGYYASSMQQFEAALSADGALSLRSLTYPSTPAQAFTYHDDGTFRDETGTVNVGFVTEENGEVYLYEKACASLPGLGLMPVSDYLGQRVEANDPGAEAQAAWDAANAKGYLLLNEKYTSQIWLVLMAQNAAETPELIPGWVGATRIVDAGHTEYAVQIPGSGGRDGHDAVIYERDGLTWMEAGGNLFVEEGAAQALYGGAGAYSTIQADGYARWYRVGALAGKTMTVTLPERGGFTVYAADGTVAASSVVYGDASAVLPEGGWVVFAGDAGARFHLECAD